MDDPRAASTDRAGIKTRALFVSVFTIATCGLIYELLAGTIASYLLGDSVTQFSTIIGVYLFSMGVGSYLSRYFRSDLITSFIEIEILVGVIGAVAHPCAHRLFLVWNPMSVLEAGVTGESEACYELDTLVVSPVDEDLERVAGIEPAYSAWKAAALPLSYTR